MNADPRPALRTGAGPSRPAWHPLAVACGLMIVTRAVALAVFYHANDPNGHRIYTSPANALLIAIPYHFAFLLPLAALLLAAWKVLAAARPAITVLGIVVVAVTLVMGQVDLAMQWFAGMRFAPMAAGTYIGPEVLSTDILAPLGYHPTQTLVALFLIVGPAAAIAQSALTARRRGATRVPGWLPIAALLVVAVLCREPMEWASAHQLDTMRPPELLFAYHWIDPTHVAAPLDEARAVAQLRRLIDPEGRVRWAGPLHPLVRVGPAEASRFGPAGAAVRPDIFVFAVESLRGADLGYVPGNYPAGQSPTPRLDALARQGVVFSSYIATGNPTPRGFFGINTGAMEHRSTFNTTGAIGTEFDALPARLRQAGYFTLALWGANPSFDNQLPWANKWYDQLVFPKAVLGFVIVRPIADDVIMDRLMSVVAAHDQASPGQPVFAYVASDNTHPPCTIKGESRLPESTIRATFDDPDVRSRCRRVLNNLDTQVGRVLDFLGTRNVRRPAVVVVVGDHSGVAGEDVPPEMRGLPHNGVVWTGALIAGPPELVGPARVETFAAGHVDLMPTLLGLVGDRGPTAALGRNLFADVPAHERRAIAVSDQGYRLDRDGWSLFVRRTQPEAVHTRSAFAPIGTLQAGVADSPFTAAEARDLWESLNTWSYLIERNRVWRTPDASGMAR